MAEEIKRYLYAEVNDVETAKYMINHFSVGREETVNILTKIYNKMKLVFRGRTLQVQNEYKLDKVSDIALCFDSSKQLKCFVALISGANPEYAVFRMTYGLFIDMQAKFLSSTADGGTNLTEKFIR